MCAWLRPKALAGQSRLGQHPFPQPPVVELAQEGDREERCEQGEGQPLRQRLRWVGDIAANTGLVEDTQARDDEIGTGRRRCEENDDIAEPAPEKPTEADPGDRDDSANDVVEIRSEDFEERTDDKGNDQAQDAAGDVQSEPDEAKENEGANPTNGKADE